MAKATDLIFFDATRRQEGALTEHQVIQNNSQTTLAQVVSNAAAATLRYRDSEGRTVTTNVVVIGSQYHNSNPVMQDRLLAHEALHYGLGLGDLALANRLGLEHNGTGDGASEAISTYLARDCKK